MTLKKIIVLLTFISLAILKLVVALPSPNNPFQLINIEGICKTENQIKKFIEVNSIDSNDLSSSVDILDVVDCTGDNDVNLINTLFQTRFQTGTGIIIIYSYL